MENASRILLGNKPGKKKKKRKYEKDLSIWNESRQKYKGSKKASAKKLPESLDGQKIQLPENAKLN